VSAPQFRPRQEAGFRLAGKEAGQIAPATREQPHI
jgi:hypothetical protein